jgi:hypothetical protein
MALVAASHWIDDSHLQSMDLPSNALTNVVTPLHLLIKKIPSVRLTWYPFLLKSEVSVESNCPASRDNEVF